MEGRNSLVEKTAPSEELSNPEESAESSTSQLQVPQPSASKGWRFWLVFVALCVTSMLAAVEGSVVSTALPTVVHDLNAGNVYVWFANVYFLTSTAFVPLIGQLCNLFGRRWMMILSVTLFALGSGISGGSTTPTMLIVGRAIQGIGGGGINLLIEVIVADLVPLRERGAYMAIVFGVFSLGTSIGPFVGGAIVQWSNWRWIFYMNLPIAGVALVLHFFFLRVNYDRDTSVMARLKRIDYAGNAILVASVVAVLIALSWGGTQYSWSSYQVLVPLILGLAGLFLFHFYETMPWVKEPTLPEDVFKRRTPAAALLLAFLQAILLFWIIYFLPVYFQAVLGMSPTLSGVALLPTGLLTVLAGAAAGVIITKTGRYRPIHFAAWALAVLGLGLFSRFNRNSSVAEWVILQAVLCVGLGLLATSVLPAVQADLPESQVATATAAFAFVRTYGQIWGVSVPAAIFNAKFATEAWRIGDKTVQETLSDGHAYSFANADLIASFPDEVRDQVIDVYSRSLQFIWYISIGFGLVGLFLTFVEKEIVLRDTLETEFGLEEKKLENSNGSASA